MITRITLTNFMSHVRTVIEPAAGLTVLVGPNNVGKSAIVAALQILCRNENSTYVMRHGEKECSVVIETDEGHVVEWRRKKSPSYVIDGQVFDRLRGSDLPDELHRVLRLPRVDAGGDLDFDVHFGTQKSPIFLLGSASAAARFFASSSDAVRLVEMQKRHKQKLADAQREKLRLEAESRQVNEELERLAPVVDIDDRLQAVEDQYTELLQLRERLIEARRDEAALAAETAQLTQRQAQADALAPLTVPPTLSPVSLLSELIVELESVQGDVTKTTARATALSTVAAPPSLHDVDVLERLRDEISRQSTAAQRGAEICHTVNRLVAPPALTPIEPLERSVLDMTQAARDETVARHRAELLERLGGPPDLDDDAALSGLLATITTAVTQAATWEAQWQSLQSVTSPPVPADTTTLVHLVAQWDDALREERRRQQRVTEATAELAEAAEALRESAAGSRCRLCGNPLDPDRVVAFAVAGLEGHAHE